MEIEIKPFPSHVDWDKLYKLCRGNMDIFERVQYVYSQLDSKAEEKFFKWLNHYYILAYSVKHTSSLYRVTTNSIFLCEKVHRDLGIWIFPVLNYPARPGWTISDGTWAWHAEILDYGIGSVTYIGSSLRIKFCVQKRVKLTWGNGKDPNEVFGVLTEEYKEYTRGRDRANIS